MKPRKRPLTKHEALRRESERALLEQIRRHVAGLGRSSRPVTESVTLFNVLLAADLADLKSKHGVQTEGDIRWPCGHLGQGHLGCAKRGEGDVRNDRKDDDRSRQASGSAPSVVASGKGNAWVSELCGRRGFRRRKWDLDHGGLGQQ